jgi:hypothetical protein
MLQCNSTFFKDCNKNEINTFKYNVYSTNGRLSSDHSNEVNILTIPHNESRKDIISKFENGLIFYFDYVSLHPRLLLLLSKRDIKIEDDIYLQFQSLLKDEYSRDEIKNILYKLMYGYVSFSIFRDESIPNIVIEYVEKLVDNYLDKKMMITPYNKEIILDSERITNGIVVSNYIQSVESDFVISKIREVNEYLKMNNCKSQICLYLYDGIILDYCRDDKLEIIKDILQILQTGDNIVFDKGIRFPVKMEYGRNFWDMKTFDNIQK